jgi:hypothetical protein
MIKLYDRADFPFKLTENLKQLLDRNLIRIAKLFDNGTASEYQVTEEGRVYLRENINEEEIISHIKTVQNPDRLLQIVYPCFNHNYEEK